MLHKTKWHTSDHEQFLTFLILFSSHYSDDLFLICTFFIFLFKRFIPCAKFSVLLICRLWHTSLPPGGCWSSERILLGHPPLWFSVIFQSFWCSWAHQSIPSLRIYLIVDLTTCNDFAASLMGLFWFFRQMIACFSGSDYSWDFLLR